MTNKEIAEKLAQYENYLHINGSDDKLVDAMCLAVELADGNHDDKFTVSVCQKAADVIREYIKRVAHGTFEELEQRVTGQSYAEYLRHRGHPRERGYGRCRAHWS